jgi:hypothetical protein
MISSSTKNEGLAELGQERFLCLQADTFAEANEKGKGVGLLLARR